MKWREESCSWNRLKLSIEGDNVVASPCHKYGERRGVTLRVDLETETKVGFLN